MGYTTSFNGKFSVSPPLKTEQAAYIDKFSMTRRVKRDSAIAGRKPDPIREAAGLPVGRCGAYFVGAAGFMGQDSDNSVIDSNSPPEKQPSLWCQWVTADNGSAVEWDGGEKFYGYVEWIQYLIQHFFAPWGSVLNGEVQWRGEDRADRGKIIITNNVVATKHGTIVYT